MFAAGDVRHGSVKRCAAAAEKQRFHRQAVCLILAPRRGERVGRRIGRTDNPSQCHPPPDDEGVERSGGSLQGGHRRHRREGQAGVRSEGQGERREQCRGEATGGGSQEIISRL